MKDRSWYKIVSVAIAVALLASVMPVCVRAESDIPMIVVSDVSGVIGDYVDVPVSIENNPGIVSMTLHVIYDPQFLKLVSVTDSGLLPGVMHENGGVIDETTKTPPYTLAWVNDTLSRDLVANGTLVMLRFQILQSAQSGTSYDVRVEYDLENYDIYDCMLNPVYFQAVSGKVTAYADLDPKIELSSVTGSIGGSVEVAVSVSNNPGIVSMSLDISYDSRYLKLTKVTDTGLLPGACHEDGGVITSKTHTPPYTLAWVNDQSRTDYMVNGVLVILTFEILERAEDGRSYPITASYDLDDYDIYNCDLEPVEFAVDYGKVSVSCDHDYLPSYTDNGDGTHKVTYTCIHNAGHSYSEASEVHEYVEGTCACGKGSSVRVVVKGQICYTIRENVITVTHAIACKIGYWDSCAGKYVVLVPHSVQENRASYLLPEGVTEFLLVVKGDLNADGVLDKADTDCLIASLLPKSYPQSQTLTQEQKFAADLDENGDVNSADRVYLARALLSVQHKLYRVLSWVGA